MKKFIGLPILFSILFAACSKQELASRSTTESIASKGGAIPNYYPGPCPYDCHDTRCKAYLNGYCGPSGNDTIAVIKNSNNPYDTMGSRHNQGLNTILPTFNFSVSNIDSEALVKTKAYVVTIGYSATSAQTAYNTVVQDGYFPFSKLPELDSLGNTMYSHSQLSSVANSYVQQIYNTAYQYLNADTGSSVNYSSFANNLISIEANIKADTRISASEKQSLLSACSVGRYSASFWANNFKGGGSNPNAVRPLFLQKLKRWIRVVASDIGGAIAGSVGGVVGAVVGAVGSSIAADAQID